MIPIDLLDDEEYRVLLDLEDGLKAFGCYCALLATGRERFHQDKAVKVGEDDLAFLNRPSFVAERAGMRSADLDPMLAVFRAAAAETGAAPWVSQPDGRLTIRGFFRFCPDLTPGRGGARPGAGRPRKMMTSQE